VSKTSRSTRYKLAVLQLDKRCGWSCGHNRAPQLNCASLNGKAPSVRSPEHQHGHRTGANQFCRRAADDELANLRMAVCAHDQEIDVC